MEDSQMKARRDNIEPRILRGDAEFFKAYGMDKRKQSEMRTKGLPCYHDGKCFIYYPEEVDTWIKNNWRLNLPNV
jgi:hypothetical protein